jgi:hypothetical protein
MYIINQARLILNYDGLETQGVLKFFSKFKDYKTFSKMLA